MSTTTSTVTVSIWHEGNPHPHRLELPAVVAQWVADTIDLSARAALCGVTTDELRQNAEVARWLGICLRTA